MAFLKDDISINTILGEGSFFSNEVKVQGNLRIQGDVDGNIEAKGNVFIGEKARVRGDILADSAEIYGIVLGDIIAPKSIIIASTAVVIGDIFSREVQIDSKAIFSGHCISIKDEAEYEKAKKLYSTEKLIVSNKINNKIGG